MHDKEHEISKAAKQQGTCVRTGLGTQCLRKTYNLVCCVKGIPVTLCAAACTLVEKDAKVDHVILLHSLAADILLCS